MSIVLACLIYGVIGVVAGILGGLLGIGGGVITVPCLFYMFQKLGYPQAYVMHMAIATSLAAMILTTLSATWGHNKRKSVRWEILKKMIPGLVIGSFVGAIIAVWLSGVILEIFFGVFLCILAIRFYLQKVISMGHPHRLPGGLVLNLFSVCIGALSNLLGIGGGSMTVPLLTSFKISDKYAIGTAAATTLLTSILGSLSYMLLGWRLGAVIPDNLGLINLPAFFILGIITALVAPYGVKLSHEIEPKKVRKIFAIVLALTGISLII